MNYISGSHILFILETFFFHDYSVKIRINTHNNCFHLLLAMCLPLCEALRTDDLSVQFSRSVVSDS